MSLNAGRLKNLALKKVAIEFDKRRGALDEIRAGVTETAAAAPGQAGGSAETRSLNVLLQRRALPSFYHHESTVQRQTLRARQPGSQRPSSQATSRLSRSAGSLQGGSGSMGASGGSRREGKLKIRSAAENVSFAVQRAVDRMGSSAVAPAAIEALVCEPCEGGQKAKAAEVEDVSMVDPELLAAKARMAAVKARTESDRAATAVLGFSCRAVAAQKKKLRYARGPVARLRWCVLSAPP